MKTNKTIRTIVPAVLMFIFIVSSVIVLTSQNILQTPQNRANSLRKTTVINGNTERSDYLDENGLITIASDVGYATMIATVEDFSRLEHFYDEKGEPISQYPGFYALLREYDEEGRNYRITYLDKHDMPVITGQGYSTKVLTFYDTGKIRTEKYYDPSGTPVCTTIYGYGLLNEYDKNGRKIKTTYLNDTGKPMVTGLGYAIIKRNYYDTEGPGNGKVESEFYFDENGDSIMLSLGQRGVHKEYDENVQESVLTYLDETGNPVVTNKGYTTVRKTYHANNYTASERYYDINGNPYALSDGQYGIEKENDQIVYLDKNGNGVFNLRRLLYNQAWIILPCAVSIILLSVLMNKRQINILLVLYIAGIAYLTLLFRENGETKKTMLLWSYRWIFANREARVEIIKNIWLFIPLGAILYKLLPNKAILLVPILLSIMIEGIQYFKEIGYCELDDVINNSIGGWIGFSMGRLANDLKQRIGIRKQHTA